MMSDDELYLLKKEETELREQYDEFHARKNLYQSMIDKMMNYEIKNTQERFLLSDLYKLINFFESKMDVTRIKLRDVSSKEFVLFGR